MVKKTRQEGVRRGRIFFIKYVAKYPGLDAEAVQAEYEDYANTAKSLLEEGREDAELLRMRSILDRGIKLVETFGSVSQKIDPAELETKKDFLRDRFQVFLNSELGLVEAQAHKDEIAQLKFNYELALERGQHDTAMQQLDNSIP